MKSVARALACALLLAALWPEFARYRGERELRKGTDGLRRALTTSRSVDEARPALESTVTSAMVAARDLPGDPRPRVLAGSARLVAGRGRDALDFYRDALATGERAEIDLNIGRAHAVAGQLPEAQATLLRALWISPALAASLPEQAAARLRDEIARLEKELKAGQLTAPPPLPE